MEYITFMHANMESKSTKEEWDDFFAMANESGMFRGGSLMDGRSTLGQKDVPDITVNIAGYMRFDADTLSALHVLLEKHPVVIHGGTIEICELPKSP